MLITRRLLAVLGAIAGLAAVFAMPAAATDGTSTRCASFTVLEPGNEVRDPGTTDPVESEGKGLAAVYVRGTRLTFSVVIANPERETFTAGHIHRAAAGENGPVVVPLFDGSSSRRLFIQYDSIEISEETAAEICGDLSGHYVNYHTTQDPQGAVRGQLR